MRHVEEEEAGLEATKSVGGEAGQAVVLQKQLLQMTRLEGRNYKSLVMVILFIVYSNY